MLLRVFFSMCMTFVSKQNDHSWVFKFHHQPYMAFNECSGATWPTRCIKFTHFKMLKRLNIASHFGHSIIRVPQHELNH